MSNFESIITRAPEVCFTQINHDAIVVLNPVDDNFYHLNEAAVDLWLSLDTPKTLLELTQMLATKYAGHSDAYRQDVIEWVKETKQQGLLLTTDNIDVKMHE